MPNKALFYKAPEEFFIQNEAYEKHKELFNRCLTLLKESEDLKIQLSGMEIDQAEQQAVSLIFLKSQVLLSWIVKGCNEGRGDIARLLLRSLFESYINAKYILKHQKGEEFLDYRVAARKKFFESYERKFPHSPLLTPEYRIFKRNLEEMFERVWDRYTDKNGKIRNRWSKYDLRAMAENVGESLTYDYIMAIYSAYVHCDVEGLSRFVRNNDNEVIFDNSPAVQDIEEFLLLGSIFFKDIVVVWAGACKAKVPTVFMDAGSSPA